MQLKVFDDNLRYQATHPLIIKVLAHPYAFESNKISKLINAFRFKLPKENAVFALAKIDNLLHIILPYLKTISLTPHSVRVHSL